MKKLYIFRVIQSLQIIILLSLGICCKQKHPVKVIVNTDTVLVHDVDTALFTKVKVKYDSISNLIKEKDSIIAVYKDSTTLYKGKFITVREKVRQAQFIINNIKRFNRIVEKSPSQIIFERGWTERAIDNYIFYK